MLKLTFTKKHILTLVSVMVLVALRLIGYEVYAAHQYDKQYKSFINSNKYTNYAANVSTFLNDNGGIMAKMYNCSATAEAVWSQASNKSASTQLAVGSPTFQYQTLQAAISSSLKSAQSNQPHYHHGLLVGILPISKHARLSHQSLVNLLTGTQSMLNQSSYCPSSFYDGIVALQFLQRDSTSGALSGDGTGWNNYISLVGRIQSHSFSQAIGVPTGATAIDMYFTDTFLPKITGDLQFVAAHPTAYSISASNFAADAAQLDSSVLPQAAQYGKTIVPSTADLSSLLSSVAN